MGEVEPNAQPPSIPFPPPPPQFCGGNTPKLTSKHPHANLTKEPIKHQQTLQVKGEAGLGGGVVTSKAGTDTISAGPVTDNAGPVVWHQNSEVSGAAEKCLPKQLSEFQQVGQTEERVQEAGSASIQTDDFKQNNGKCRQNSPLIQKHNGGDCVNNIDSAINNGDHTNDWDRSLQDSGIFTADNFALSPEPPSAHTSEHPEFRACVEGVKPSTEVDVGSPQLFNGEETESRTRSSQGVTTITIVCSKTSVDPSSSGQNSASSSSSSLSPSSTNSSSSLVYSSLSVSSSSSSSTDFEKCRTGSFPDVPVELLGPIEEPSPQRGRLVKRSKRRKDENSTTTINNDDSSRKRSSSRKRDENQHHSGNSTRTLPRVDRHSSRPAVVPLPSTSYPTKYRQRQSKPPRFDDDPPHPHKTITNGTDTSLGGEEGGGEASVALLDPSAQPISHPAQEPPMCSSCFKKGCFFFSINCDNCWFSLKRGSLTPSQVFAVLRQWDARVQRNIGPLVGLAVRGGCGINDRDAVTDMTLLHYAVKAGARGVGDPTVAVQVVEELLLGGADVHQRCKWTHMTALHYAAFFDVPLALELLLQDTDGVCINDPCLEYDAGSPLHMAAANLCLGAARLLLRQGADTGGRDGRGRSPADCIPDPDQYKQVPDVQDIIRELQFLLGPHNKSSPTNPIPSNPAIGGRNGTNTHNGSSPGGFPNHGCLGVDGGGCPGGGSGGGRAVLLAMGLRVGDRVLVNGVKTGVLRFVGCTEFSTGLWAGVELEAPEGRHNGTVRGVVYFRCANNYGLFVPVVRLTKIPNVSRGRIKKRRRAPSLGRPALTGRNSPGAGGRLSAKESKPPPRRSLSLPSGRVNHGKVDVSKIGSRVAQDIRDNTRRISVADRVVVDLRVPLAPDSPRNSPPPASRKLSRSRAKTPTTTNNSSSSDESPNSSNFYISSCSLNSQILSSAFDNCVLGHRGVATGTVRFAGMVAFASGYWVGVELDEAIGSNDGSVNGVRYFDSRTKHGVFAAPSRVVKLKDTDGDGASLLACFPPPVPHRRSSNNIVNNKNNTNGKSKSTISLFDDSTNKNTKANNTTKKNNNYSDIKPRIDNGRNNAGNVKKAANLDKKKNATQATKNNKNTNNNAKNNNKNNNYNLNSQKSTSEHNIINSKGQNKSSRKNKRNNSKDQHNLNNQSLSSHSIHEHASMPSKNIDNRYLSNGSGLEGYSNLYGSWQNELGNGHSGDRLDNAVLPQVLPDLAKSASIKNDFYPTNTSMSNLNKSFSARYISSRLRQEELVRRKEEEKHQPQWHENVSTTPEARYNPHHLERVTFDCNWLDIGCNVFYKGKIGTVRYIGPVDFELGTWLGVELRDPNGKHDGVVMGRRYFSCRTRHGVMVRPAKVTVRGINGASLVREEDYEEDGEEGYWI